MTLHSGIYLITHTGSGKVYVGSAVHFGKRWRVHKCQLRQSCHHSPHLQRAWDKYGETAFEFTRILFCEPNELLFFENRAIKAYRAANRKYGFNIFPTAGSSFGTKMSPESCIKMSKAAKARRQREPLSPEHIEKMHAARKQKGYFVSEETKKKIRATKALSPQIVSVETRAKLSAARKGRKMPDWFPEFMRKKKTGTKHTLEAKAKISVASIARNSGATARAAKTPILFNEDVIEIQTLWESGAFRQYEIAELYGVDPSMVSLIVNRKRWNN